MAGVNDTGVVQRHRKDCAGGRCSCSWEAWAFDARAGESGKKIRKTFATKGAAKTWRQDMLVALRRGEVRASESVLTVDAAVAEWLEAARRGTVRTRGRKPFSGATIRSVEQNHRLRVSPRFGRRRLERLTLLELQEWVDELDAEGTHPGTIETSVLPLRLVYRRAKTKGVVAVDPTEGLELPQKPTRGSSRRPPAAENVHALIDAAPERDRAAWTIFLLAGLRRGELQGLRWSDVDLEAGIIHVERQYSSHEAAFTATKGRRNRKVPCGPTLAAALRAHRLATGRREGLVFGADGRRPIDAGKLQDRADAAWEAVELERVTPHACRHLFATLMAAAGTPLERLSRYMGHSSIAVTWDNYGHLFPGDETTDAALQEAFLADKLARGLAREA